ncbi:FMN phosphatase YigB (HAD superfamily) [Sinorhizobium medicae]
MTRKTVDTLILDLDNTIFDWFAVWYASFEPIYKEIIRVTGLPPQEIEKNVRAVHQARRTSEYTFLLEELEALKHLRDGEDIRARFHDALEESRHGRDKNLKLYPSVFRCLWDLKKRGTKIIAYTESMGFYSAHRLKRFGLDGVIDVLFSPEDHDLPAGVSLDKLRRLPDEYYELQVTQVRHKPNPRVLLDIIQAVGATIDRCAYVGDSLFKDVAMARDIGVFDIHAKYGTSQQKPEYALLQKVSHWTEADVQREREITAKGHSFEPSAVLKETFAEIFIYCDFQPFAPEKKKNPDADEIKNSIEVWKKTVDVQQHFNDLEMRIRNFAITIIGVLIAAVGFTYQQGLQTSVFGYRFAAGLGLIVAAAVVWLGFFLMDRFWYHILLKGAVAHARKIEEQLKDKVAGISLGKTITEVSGSVKIFGVTMNSDKRLTNFYLLGFAMLAVVFVSLVFASPSGPNLGGGSALSAPLQSVPLEKAAEKE